MGFFESVKRLHDLELYEDLLRFADLQLAEHRLASLMAADEQAYVYACVGDAHRECGNAGQSVRVSVSSKLRTSNLWKHLCLKLYTR